MQFGNSYVPRTSFLSAALGLIAITWCATMAWAAEGPYYVKGTQVNLRNSPGGEIQGQLENGEKLFVVSRQGDWCEISLPARQQRGWMHADYIDFAGNKSSSTAETTSGSVDSRAAKFTPSTDVTNVVTDLSAANVTEPPVESAVKSSSSAQIQFASVDLTSPAKLGSADYKPVGGAQLASISGSGVNLRESAALNAPVLGKVEQGDKAYVVANADPWYLVSVPARDLRGWVFGEYVDAMPRVEIKADQVRLREGPSLDSAIRDELNRGDIFYKLEARDGWVKVASSASGLSGWVKAEYVRRSEGSVSRPYRVTGDNVNFRAYPAVDSDVIAKLPLGETVNVLGRNDKWAYAYYSGHKGWMYTEYLDDGSGDFKRGAELRLAGVTPKRTLSWKEVGGTSVGNRLIERARVMMGTPYVWGGESDNGVDCSGLIYKLLCDEGCDVKCLPRRASEQMAQLGLAVDKEELAPGDLVFFTTYKAGPSHVGIYLGDGDFIHASSAQRKVTVSNLGEGYYRSRFVGARRLTEEELRQLQ